jgi:uncharacterized protein (TIGR02145 family)
MDGSTYSGDPNTCNIYGALYSWETLMMVDGKYSDETKTSSAWDNSWLAGNYYNSGSPAENPNADKNVARGGRGICPKGWHVPTYREWAVMLDAVEGVDTHMQTAIPSIGASANIGTASNLLKSSKVSASSVDLGDGSWVNCSSCTWSDPYGFSMLPAGQYDANPEYLCWRLRGWHSNMWTGTPSNDIALTISWNVSIFSSVAAVGTRRGLSTRCIMDE